jgi:phenylacetate-CoA ligase
MPFRRFVIEHVAFPLHDAAGGRSYLSNRRFLEKSQWWGAEQLREHQWSELSKLLDIAFQVPYYREKYSAAGAVRGDIRTWEDYARLPKLTRGEVNRNRERLTNPHFTKRLVASATGGSSGTPTRFFLTVESYDWRRACRDRLYDWTGAAFGEPTLLLWGSPIGKVARTTHWKSKLVALLIRSTTINTFSQSPAMWAGICEQFQRIRPKTVTAYVSSLEAFCAYVERHGVQLPAPRAVVSAAEAVFPGTRETVRRVLGSTLWENYGSREFMSIACECEQHDGLHIQAENVVVEMEQPGPSPSALLVTDLHNHGMPFLRYEIGDAGRMLDGNCACGRGAPRLAAIDGRLLDVLRTANGRVVPGEFFPHLVKDLTEVRQFQVQQMAMDRIVIRAVLDRPLSEASRSLLEREVGKVFGTTTSVEIEAVDRIPTLASGKRRVTIGLDSSLAG